MSIKTTIAAVSLLSVLSFATYSAESINAQQATDLEKIGVVSISGISVSPMDMRQALSAKAEAKGATAYHVTESHQGNNWHATADIYK